MTSAYMRVHFAALQQHIASMRSNCRNESN